MIPRINQAIFYKDEFSVFRLQKMINPDRSIHQTLLPIADLQNVPCRISRISQDEAKNDNPMANQIAVGLMLFTAVGYDIKAGDTVKVSRQHKYQHYITGEPYVYDNHQQVTLHRKEEA